MSSFEDTFDDCLNRLRDRLSKTVETTRIHILRLGDGTVLEFEHPADGKRTGTKEGLVRLVDSFHERLELAAMEAVEDGDANDHEPSIKEIRDAAAELISMHTSITDAAKQPSEEAL